MNETNDIFFDQFANIEDAFSDFWADQLTGKEDDDETQEDINPRSFRKTYKRKQERIKQKETLCELIREPPRKGEEIHVVGANKFMFFTWIPMIIDWIEYADEYYCSTWTANFQSAKEFFDLCDAGKVRGEVGFMFGTYFKRREPVVYARYAEELHKRGGWIKSFENHAKIMLLSNKERGDFLTVEGSGNLTNNPRFEQYVIINDRDLWEWHKDWIQEIKTLKKKAPW